MLFHAAEFVLVFLPVTLLAFLLLERSGRLWLLVPLLVVASLVFYAWWDWRFLGLLVGSILVNYGIGAMLARREGGRPLLVSGVAFNLAAIALFKYADFALGTFAELAGGEHQTLGILLPLGISFFTFQQIAWLVDLHASRPRRVPRFLDYALFISFFPQLIAGPIVHWSEAGWQYGRMWQKARSTDRALLDITVGLAIFAVGLAKKIVVADYCAAIATPVFTLAQEGRVVPPDVAWGATLAYTMQIYFDFSGYSDMAIGLARMFGVRLPANFYSPYKQTSIIGFWRTWHMTLSRFLRDYVYIPLGGSRKGRLARHFNLLATMVIGGLWHGAAWAFVLWGALHGLFLVVNHLWRALRARLGLTATGLTANLGQWGAWFLTMACVVHAWVLFRAETMLGAGAIYRGMYSFVLGPPPLSRQAPSIWISDSEWATIAIAALIAVFAPNTVQIFRRYRPVVDLALLRGRIGADPFVSLYWRPKLPKLRWRPAAGWACVTAALLISYIYAATRTDAYVEFIYFRF